MLAPALLAVLLAAGPGESTSVYRLRPLADGLVIGSSLAVVGGAYLLGDGLITRRCPCDPAEVNAIDRHVIGNHSRAADLTSDVTVGLSLAAPIALAALDDGLGPELVEDLAVAGEAMAVSGAAVTVAKYVVQRPLPVVYAGQAPELVGRAGGYRSFYSGHTTLATSALTATAMTYTLRHGSAVWPWLIVGGVATSVAVERTLAGQHFYSDVAVGGLTGAAIGIAVPLLHTRPELAGVSVAAVRGGALIAYAGAFELSPGR
jgi:hypothetical protein